MFQKNVYNNLYKIQNDIHKIIHNMNNLIYIIKFQYTCLLVCLLY